MIELYGADREDYELTETLDGKEISYISRKTARHLRKIHQDMYFIPVTTRTTEQYQRIAFFQKEVIPEYAVTTNGGCILQNGSPIREWSSFIESRLQSCMPMKDMLGELAKLPLSEAAERIRTAHHYFVYLILGEEGLRGINAACVKAWAADKGWQASLQGRKLYFIPEPLNKWRAVDYLKRELNIDEVYTAGDSLLDFELIAQADYGVSPAHGEVLHHYPDLNATMHPGMKAADEITEHIVKLGAARPTKPNNILG